MSSRTNSLHDIFHAYERAVIGTARARHTYFRRLKTISALADGLAGKRVLDVGCGYGFRTHGLLKEGARKITGMDLDRDRILGAQAHSLKKGLGGVTFMVADSEEMGVRSRCFDLIVADEMIHHLESLPRAFREMYRILRPGGTLVISDHNRLSLPSEFVRTLYFGQNKENVFSASQIKGLLENTGFRDIMVRHILFTLPLAGLRGKMLKMNRTLESLIEQTPLLRRQCGVYVIRGIK